MKKPLVVNLCSGPGAGKSTLMAYTFAYLKAHKICTAEMSPEVAKMWLYQNRSFDSQEDLFIAQLTQLHAIVNNPEHAPDVIITDSPLFLSIIYGKNNSEDFNQLVWDTYHSFNNLLCYVKREKDYVQKGRFQTEAEAREKDTEVFNLLVENNVPFHIVPGNLNNDVVELIKLVK